MDKERQLISEKWYKSIGWLKFNDWLIELSANNITFCYVDNLEIIPSYIDTDVVMHCFNEDSNAWKMMYNKEKDLILKNTYTRKGRRKK